MEKKNYFAWLSFDDGKPVKFAELAHMMAKALHPSDDELMDYGVARLNLDQELPQAVQRGELVVRNAAGLGRHTFPVGQALKTAVILPQDLSVFLGARGIGLRIGNQPTQAGVIDWEYWAAMLKAKEWQACALSLGLDPDSLKGHPQAWMAGPDRGPLFTSDSFSSNDVQVKFEKRLRLLRANRYDREVFTLPQSQYGALGPDEVLLSEFAAWGQSVGWNNMPPELVALAKPEPLPRSMTPQSGKPIPAVSADEWDARVEQEDEAQEDREYKAMDDRGASLYIERGKLIEYLPHQHPGEDSNVKKRLSEVQEKITKLEAATAAVPLSQASTTDGKPSLSKTRIEPQGGDSLTPTIWTICYDLKDAGKNATARSVMAELKRMAAAGIHPLTSTTAGGVKYEYEKGDEQELTSPQLDKRIQEWRKKIGG